MHKYGEERVSQMIGGMQKTATAEGIDIVYTGDISTTLPAHRLISWSKAKGKQNELVEKIFVQYFAKGKAPADVDMLVQAAVDAGLDRAEAQAFLDGSELKAKVVDEAAHVKRSFGVSGVPFFVVHVDGADALPIGVSGAQEPDVLVKVGRLS
jgi:predicted DsbA family dithiol-disulfide isomerase